MTQTMVRQATKPMVGFVDLLLRQRVASDELVAVASERPLSFSAASHLIDTLRRMPYKTAMNTPTSKTLPNSVPVRDVKEGIFTVLDSDKNYVTLKVARESWCDGKAVISWLNGSNNEFGYMSFGFITPVGISIWAKRRADVPARVLAAAQFLMTGDLDEAREQFFNQAETYALASGRCLACLRLLTTPKSLNRNLGPDCYARLREQGRQS